jgi:allantoate deiminase
MSQKTIFNLKEKLLETYDVSFDYNGISGKRLAERLGALSKIGLTEQNGSYRTGFSFEEKEAKELVMKWMKESGLSVHQDGAGNVFGRLEGKRPDVPAILSGSHVDSVPNGGHFDGPLGVLSALEVAEAWRETEFTPEKPFEVVIFSDEEGSRFHGGLNGSEAFMGSGDLDEKIKKKDTNGESFEKVLQDVGLSLESYSNAKRDLDDIETFIEIHIEQGKRLEKEELPCGIVTGIAGPHWLEYTFQGEAGHAGNTPMNDRKDALLAASEFIVKLNQIPQKINDTAVATVGKLHVEPNGVNVIPGKVTLYVDSRDIYEESRDTLVNRIIQLGEEIGVSHKLSVTYKETLKSPPVPISEDRQELLEEAMKVNSIRPYRLPSGAGHDAMVLGEQIPIVMLFVKSKDGISHNPAEWSDLNDCIQTIHVLKTYIEKLQY